MANSQSIVEEIERVLANPETMSLDDLGALASDYSQLCRRVNERLGMSIEQANIGNIDEAVRLMRIFNSLDEYNHANFPQLEMWRETCRTLDLETPTPLAEDRAFTLLGLYDTYASMEPLLRQMRSQALKHAPLNKRLETLYQIEPFQPLNPIWGETIQEFERRRLTDIQSEWATLPKGIESAGRIKSLQEELSSPQRKEPVPKNLLAEMTRLTGSFRIEMIFDYLRKIGTQMESAYREMDKVKLQRLVNQWLSTIKQNNIASNSLPEDLRQLAHGPLIWYMEVKKQEKKEADFERLLATVEQSLISDDDLDELTANYSALAIAAESGDFVIPESVVIAYEQRVRSVDLAIRRRQIIRLTAIVVFFALIGAGVFWGIRSAAHSSEIKTHAATISRYIDSFTCVTKESADPDNNDSEEAKPETKIDLGALAAARSYVDNIPPEDQSVPVLREQIVRLEQEEAKEKKRVEDFAALEKRLNESLAENIPLKDEMGRLTELARTDDEIISVANLKKRQNEVIRGNEDAHNERYNTLLLEITEEEQRLENEVGYDLDAMKKGIKTLKKKMADLDAMNKKCPVTARYVQAAGLLAEKITSLENGLQTAEDVSASFKELTNAVGNVNTFGGVLKKTAEQYSSEPFAASFLQVIAGLGACATIENANLFAEHFSAAGDKVETNTEVYERLHSEYMSIEKTGAFIPGVVDFKDYFDDYAQLVASGGRKALLEKLNKLLVNYASKVWVWHNQSADQYFYFTDDPNVVRADQSMPFHFQVDKSGKTAVYTERRGLNQNDYEQMILAPHHVIVSEIIPLLSDTELANDPVRWEMCVAKIFEELMSSKYDLRFDPVIRMVLLLETLRIVCNDPIFSDGFTPWLEEIQENRGFDPFVNWYSTSDKKLEDSRIASEQILKHLMLIMPLDRRLEKAKDRALSSVRPSLDRFEWVGWIDRHGSQWRCRMKNGNQNGPLFIYRTSATSQMPELVPIGTQTGDSTDITDTDGLMRGLPVFIRKVVP